jgi:hypothetical protein
MRKTSDAVIRNGNNSVHPYVYGKNMEPFGNKLEDLTAAPTDGGKHDLLLKSSCNILQQEKFPLNRLLLMKSGFLWISALGCLFA